MMELFYRFTTTEDLLAYLRESNPWPTWYVPHDAYRAPSPKKSAHRRRRKGRA